MTASALPTDVSSLWQSLIGLPAEGRGFADWPGRAGWIDMLSPALIAELAPALPLDPALAQEGRLYGRFQQSVQLQALDWIAEAGVSCVAIKGFAAAFLYYPTPATRLIGDLDILLRSADLPRVVAALARHGFRFGGVARPAWGFLSDASFLPFFSADRNCNVDLHVRPDSYPLYLGLDTEQVFDRARQVMAQDRAVAVPCAEHLALILISNLAKDKFAPSGLRKLLDLGRLIVHEPDLNWDSLRVLAQRAHLSKALATTLALLRSMGMPASLLPSDMPMPQGAAFTALLRDWLAQRPPSLLRRLQREWLLAAEPGVAATLMWRRASGLWRGRSGVPDLAAMPVEAAAGQARRQA